MQHNLGAWFRLALPALLVMLAYFGRGAMETVEDDAQVILANLPYLLCVLAALMAYQFNRSRFILAAAGVALFYWLVQTRLQVSLEEPGAARAYLASSLSISVLALYLLVLPERGLLTVPGAVAVLGFVALGALTYFAGPLLAESNPGAADYYAPWSAQGNVLSRGSSLLAGLVIAAGLAQLVLRQEESDAALLGTYVALLLALARLHLPAISVAMGIAAALCVLLGVLRSSHAMAYRDELTGLPGRRALNERLKMLGRRYTIAMLDVDHFKRFNDTHGHDVGDQVLCLVASRIRRVRGGGTAFRYGGEEFCVLFPRRELAECIEPMDEIRDEIANYKMSIRDRSMRPKQSREGARKRGATRLKNDEVRLTVSVGLAERTDDRPDAMAVIKAADQKLYQAKRAGRNRVAS